MGDTRGTMADAGPSSDDAQNLTFDTAWTWWEHTQGGDYAQSAKILGTCDNVAMFWKYFNNIPRPLAFFTSRNERRKLVGNRKVFLPALRHNIIVAGLHTASPVHRP